MMCFDVRMCKKLIFSMFITFFLLSMPICSKAADGDLKWAFQSSDGGFFSSPAIAPDGTIYAGTYSDEFYAINKDGSKKWSYLTGTGSYSSPAVDEAGTIYFVTACCDCSLIALNSNGTFKRRLSLSYSCPSSLYSSPGIAPDGTIYVGSYEVVWVDPISLKETCTHNTNYLYVHSSAAIARSNVFYIGDNQGYLHSLGPGCRYNWKFKTGDDVFSSPAIGSDGTIYVGSDDNKLYAINPNGTLKWSFQTDGDVWSSPAIAPDGTIYVGSDDNNLYAINPNGTLKWSFTTGDDVGSSPAIAADGTIYVGSVDDKLYALYPDGTLKWAFTTGGDVRSSPAIGNDGTVYVGSYDGKLYAIEDNTGGLAVSPWPMFRQNPRHTGLSPDLTPDSDNDGDGYTESQDCDDDDNTIHPGAIEICGDGIDQDCDGSDLACTPAPDDIDNDGDGYTENQGDCNDSNASIYPGAVEICGDGIDQDCDGAIDEVCGPSCTGDYAVQIQSKLAVGKVGKFADITGGQLSFEYNGAFELDDYSTVHDMAGTYAPDANGKSILYMPSAAGLAALEASLIDWLESYGLYSLDFVFEKIKTSKVKIDKNTGRATGKIKLDVSGTVSGCAPEEGCGTAKFKYKVMILLMD